MLELSVLISLQPSCLDYLILICVTTDVGLLWGYMKDVFSTPIAYLAKLKVLIMQHILNMTP